MGAVVVKAPDAGRRRWEMTRGAQWAVVFLFGLTLALAALNLLYTANYVSQYERHSCQALNLLVSIPAPKPADPAANPSRELNYRFHEALVYWQTSNGCGR
jgi:uncharacterized membrane protein